MKVTNYHVYDIAESIVASGYPMRTDFNGSDINNEIEAVSYIIEHKDFIDKFIDYQNSYKDNNQFTYNGDHVCAFCGDYAKQRMGINGEFVWLCPKHSHQANKYGCVYETKPKYILLQDYVEIYIPCEKANFYKIKLDYCDLEMFFNHQWSQSRGYVFIANQGESLHRLLLNADQEHYVDHINRDNSDYRRCNLRLCSPQDNTRNKSKLNTNNNYIGVSYDKNRLKYRAYITVNKKQIFLGRFDKEEEALIARLVAEAIYFGEFSPQIHLFEKYGIDFSMPVIQYHKIMLPKAIKHYQRIIRLAQAPLSSGHCTALAGIVVNFDLTAPRYFWNEFQRYHFLQIVSSSSQVHKLTSFDLEQVPDLTEEVWRNAESLIEQYKKEAITWDELVANMPQGIELTARISTNYLQLKTIYNQRKNHRSKHWKEFCEWIKTLPLAKELIING